MTETNYATLKLDPVSGLHFIIDLQSKQRLFKHPPCGICGIATYSFSTEPQACGHHSAERRERNDNTEAA